MARKGTWGEWIEEAGLTRIADWCRNGATNEQIAEKIGIGQTTLYEWVAKFPQLANTLKKTKEIVDAEVENALYKSAIGFKEKVIKMHKVKEQIYNTKTGKVSKTIEKFVPVEEEVYIAPNVAAQFGWLNNRRSQTWRKNVYEEDKQVNEMLETIAETMASIRKGKES